jgi:hypothetical protein
VNSDPTSTVKYAIGRMRENRLIMVDCLAVNWFEKVVVRNPALITNPV